MRGFNTIAAAFSNRNYVIYTIGYAPSQIGIWMQRLAVGWLTWELTESATWLGIVAFADLVPLMVFGPLAGIVVDRFDRLSITRLMQSGMGVVAAILWLLTFTRADHDRDSCRPGRVLRHVRRLLPAPRANPWFRRWSRARISRRRWR